MPYRAWQVLTARAKMKHANRDGAVASARPQHFVLELVNQKA